MLDLKVCELGLVDYSTCLSRMQNFTLNRDENTEDEFWIVEHPPVFTQGQAGKPEHILAPKDIPVVKTDRGGQVTYHGPGQLVIYLLVNLKKKNYHIKSLVCKIEQAVIDTLEQYNIQAHRIDNAPGIYVKNDKICQLGLRIKKGCSYHGLSLNIDMDLEPFSRINPCGFTDLKVVQVRDFVNNIKYIELKDNLIIQLTQQLEYRHDVACKVKEV